MMLHYFMDPLCGWCYGFSPVIKTFAKKYKSEFDVEVISGGMVKGEQEKPIGDMADFLKQAYKRVEDTASVKFGEKFLQNVEEGTMVYSSVPGSIALSVFKSFDSENDLSYVADIQFAIYSDGINPSDMDYYATLAESYNVPSSEFLKRAKEDRYRKEAYDDFSVAQQFKVTGYPTLIIHARDEYFLLSKGYTTLENLERTYMSIRETINV